jgi:hypothetical protein
VRFVGVPPFLFFFPKKEAKREEAKMKRKRKLQTPARRETPRACVLRAFLCVRVRVRSLYIDDAML